MTAGRNPATADALPPAQVVLGCRELAPTLAFFTERLGFRLERITPADDPCLALVFGRGLRILLRRGDEAAGTLQIPTDLEGDPQHEVAPNGTRIEWIPRAPALVIPKGRDETVLSRAEEASWVTGRAGMRYRDLIPGRQGGRLAGSVIQIREGGAVPDSVHFHSVRFQMIFCSRGWVRVVYQDQGEPIVLAPGDAVLQPPGIRHRVLESSSDLEVVELSCPAQHDTWLDHELELPNVPPRTGLDYGGQRFAHHVANRSPWLPWQLPPLEGRCLGFRDASAGWGEAQVVRSNGPSSPQPWLADRHLRFLHVLRGEVEVRGLPQGTTRLTEGDSLTLAPGQDAALGTAASASEFLCVQLAPD